MLIWGFNFVALKLALLQFGAPASALVRAVLMYGVLLVLCRMGKMSLRYPPGTFWRISLQGFLAMGLYMVFFVSGMRTSTPAEGAIILGCGPVFTLLLAACVGQERFRLSILWGTLLAFAGVGLVVYASPTAHTGGAIQGNLLLLVSAVIWAAATVVSRPIVRDMHPLRMLTLSMPAGLVALLPYGLMDTIHTPWSQLNATSIWMMLYFSLAAGVVGFVLFYRGVQEVGASGAMLYQYLVSPIAALSGFLFMGIPMAPLQFVGLIVVLSGVTLSNLARQRDQGAPVPVE